MRMREPETFDAFYARTVSSVTSQMHALAGGDPQADHAIREAYARAYQQWYEVSGYRDPESWVLDIAREAFERRRSQEPAAPQAPESGTWPGIYRPRAAAGSRPADPEATVTNQGSGALGGQENRYQADPYAPPAV
jgi:DNA-directed RNA polymerase specialized sigma24 family protein